VPQGPAPPKYAVPVIAAEVLVQDARIWSSTSAKPSRLGCESARVAGFLTRSASRKDISESITLLYTIDPLPFAATLAQAQGQLAQAEAIGSKRSRTPTVSVAVARTPSRASIRDALAAERSAAGSEGGACGVNGRSCSLITPRSRAFEGLVGKTEVNRASSLVREGHSADGPYPPLIRFTCGLT